jgi:DNA (cytosine-5)-methyltransferase 1
MRFGSVCSGIEAASVAWHPLGWKAAWLSEIEPFPCAVLAHHYPDVPNLGDMTTLPERILSGEVEAPDLFCGGTPCQAFSVAGLRNSLDDARGNLSLTFVGIANAIDHVRSVRSDAPGIIFWENVPGVLSTKDNAFGCFLGALAGEDDPIIPSGEKWTNAGCVYGPQRTVAWRVLDAQYFGVAQRRRRVFVVASARNDFDPAAVLFEFDGMRRDSAPSRETGKDTADGAGECAQDRSGVRYAHYSHDYAHDRLTDPSGVNPALTKEAHASGNLNIVAQQPIPEPFTLAIRGRGDTHQLEYRQDGTANALLTPNGGRGGIGVGAVAKPIALQDITPREKAQNGKGWNDDGTAYTVDTHATQGVAQPIAFQPGNLKRGCGSAPNTEVFPTLAASHGRGQSDQDPHVAQPINIYGGNKRPDRPEGGFYVRTDEDTSKTLNAATGLNPTCSQGGTAVMQYVGGVDYENNAHTMDQPTGPLLKGSPTGGGRPLPAIATAMQVRRLTPVECERLQGFPDGYTNIPWRKKPEAPDGPRYKALGNSWAVPNVHWIGKRIQEALNALP